MSLKKAILAASVLLVSLNANADLTSYTGAGGVGLVYSSIGNITWTQDANLFKTLYANNNNLVKQITTVTPTYDDQYWGLQQIGDGGNIDDFEKWLLCAATCTGDGGAIDDFDTSSGRLSWWGGKAFVNYLNNISYGGSNEWRMPTTNAIYEFDNTLDSELGQLFFSELRMSNEHGFVPDNNIPINVNFINYEPGLYWLGTEYASNPSGAWYIDGAFPGVNFYRLAKFSQNYVWAYSPGQVAAVPLPAASWFMLTGLLGLLGVKRFKKQAVA